MKRKSVFQNKNRYFHLRNSIKSKIYQRQIPCIMNLVLFLTLDSLHKSSQIYERIPHGIQSMARMIL